MGKQPKKRLNLMVRPDTLEMLKTLASGLGLLTTSGFMHGKPSITQLLDAIGDGTLSVSRNLELAVELEAQAAADHAAVLARARAAVQA